MSELEKYKVEAKERWGKTDAYKEYTEKTKDYGNEKWTELAGAMDGIFAEFAGCMKNGASPESGDAQALVKKLQDHITENHYTCTKQILGGLGQMYVLDERFAANIDRQGESTARFVSKAIAVYCS